MHGSKLLLIMACSGLLGVTVVVCTEVLNCFDFGFVAVAYTFAWHPDLPTPCMSFCIFRKPRTRMIGRPWTMLERLMSMHKQN